VGGFSALTSSCLLLSTSYLCRSAILAAFISSCPLPSSPLIPIAAFTYLNLPLS
jgi:hypothetical protein